MRINPLFATDFYKTGHVAQYPAGTEMVYSNFTCRSDKFAQVLPDFDPKVVFFGLQGVLTDLANTWKEDFFERSKTSVLAEYSAMMNQALGVDAVSTKHIAELHDLGYLPLRIKALPEGSRVDIRVPLFTIRNTDPRFYWLTNYLETWLSADLWKSITSATTAYEYRRLFEKYASETGVDSAFVDFQGHDFSMRGMSGIEDATRNGAAHLLSFRGTDTISAIAYLKERYFAKGFVGGSVPATEHSVMCMGGEMDEFSTFHRLITQTYPKGIVSIVSDTWDFWKVVTETMYALKPYVMLRDGKVVIRPDSGDPVKIICGDPDAKPDTPEFKGAVECLWEIYGGTINDLGFQTLNSHVGLIYGDSISLERAQRILADLKAKGFSSANIVFGIGSYTYQHVTRDTFGTAIKATYGVVNGRGRELCKNPKTDSGVKKSAAGLLRVEKEGDNFVLYDKQSWEEEEQGVLRTVFLDGTLVPSTFETIRLRLLGR